MDFTVPAPAPGVTGDEQIAREEIVRFYDDRVAAAREAYEKAAAELADAQRLRDTWREHGEIVSVYPATYPDPLHQTVMDIVGDAQGRYTSAGREFLRPALEAPTSAAGVAELYRLGDRPEAPALHEAAEELRARHNALCRWLTAQGHDLDPLGELLNEDETPRRPKAKAEPKRRRPR